ncbi:hypothetical protein RSAG8_10900, partial [Rhizoctonia solani AG-8 WAC10335]
MVRSITQNYLAGYVDRQVPKSTLFGPMIRISEPSCHIIVLSHRVLFLDPWRGASLVRISRVRDLLIGFLAWAWHCYYLGRAVDSQLP